MWVGDTSGECQPKDQGMAAAERWGVVRRRSASKGKRQSVTCGGHNAETCEECPPEGAGSGANFCHGDCVWVGNQCALNKLPEATAKVQLVSDLGVPLRVGGENASMVSCSGQMVASCALCVARSPHDL